MFEKAHDNKTADTLQAVPCKSLQKSCKLWSMVIRAWQVQSKAAPESYSVSDSFLIHGTPSHSQVEWNSLDCTNSTFVDFKACHHWVPSLFQLFLAYG